MCVAKVDRLSEAIDMCHVNTTLNLIDFDQSILQSCQSV